MVQTFKEPNTLTFPVNLVPNYVLLIILRERRVNEKTTE